MDRLRWWVAVDGYQWVRTADEVVVPADAIRPDDDDELHGYYLAPVVHKFREYDPIKLTGLFGAFASTPSTPAEMLMFANEYGHLGDAETELDEPLDPPEFDSPDEEEKWWRDAERFMRLFDPIEHWEQNIALMRSCVKDWEKIQRGIAKPDQVADLLAKVNDQILEDRFRLSFRQDTRMPSGINMQVVPTSLLAVMWMQLGQAMMENRCVRACAVCGRWYEVSPPSNRKSKTYCNDACKSQAYRNRKDQAARMARQGKQVDEIAKVLNTKVRTVRAWIK